MIANRLNASGVVVSIAIAACGCSTDSRPARSTATNAEVITIDHDFGVVRPGTSHRATIKIENVLESPITVHSTQSSCGCVVLEFPTTSIPPRTTANLEIQYRAPPTSGRDARNAMIYFIEDKAIARQINIRANVREEVAFSEPEIVFTVRTPDVQSRRLEISNYGSEDWGTVRLESPSAWLSAEVKEIAPRDGSLQSFVASVDVQTGGRFTLDSDGSSALTLTGITATGKTVQSSIPVFVKVEPALTIVPKHLFFGEVNTSEERSKTLRIFIANTNLIAAESVSVSHDLGDCLRVEASVVSFNRLDVMATLFPERALPHINGEVKVTTKDGHFLASIPVRAKVDIAASKEDSRRLH